MILKKSFYERETVTVAKELVGELRNIESTLLTSFEFLQRQLQ